MLPSDKCDDDACQAVSRRGAAALSSQPLSSVLFSSLPFLLTFAIVSIAVLYKLFPLLSGRNRSEPDDEHFLPHDAPPSLRQSHSQHGNKTFRRRAVALSFSTTIALAAVLAELILCEISNSLNPAVRTLALQITIPTLLFLLIVLIPFLELTSVVSSAGWSFHLTGKRRRIPKMTWLLQMAGFAAWLLAFWSVGKGLPGTYIYERAAQHGQSLSEACLERVGVIGISLMAILSGFASVSSPWQSFGVKQRHVTESDIARKRAGLDATNDMLGLKRSRLRALQRKMSDTPQNTGFMTKVIGSIRPSSDVQEVKMLQLEISGLENMATTLASSLGMLEARHATQLHAQTPLGRLMVIPSTSFSVYCLYRVVATLLTSLRRWHSSGSTFSNTDPINRVLGILAKHVDPTLDQLAWSRQISFLLSGVILLASFSSVLQTFHLFARYVPSLLHQAQANLALLIAQISATYVISSALLLRSNLPREMGSVISSALGAPLELQFVDRWFEGWFLVSAVVTAGGIWAGRKLGEAGEWDEWEEGDLEGQKRS